MVATTAGSILKLAPSQFSMAGATYPLETEQQARAALDRAQQFGSPQEIATVHSAVKRKFPAVHKAHMANKKMNAAMNALIRSPGGQG